MASTSGEEVNVMRMKATFCFNWTVDKFADSTEFCILSPVFSGPSPFDTLRFQLKLYPKGRLGNKVNRHKVFVSLLLCLVEPQRVPVKVTFKVTFKVSLLKHQLMGFQTSGLFIPHPYVGFRDFIERNTLLDPKEGLMIDGKLTISSEIAFEETGSQEDAFHEDLIQLSLDLKQFMADESSSDVVLKVENKEIKAHKAILSLRSPVFEAMFKPETKETREGFVEVTDFKFAVIQRMVAFLYTGRVEVRFCDFELLQASDYYESRRLKAICESELISKLTTGNAVQSLVKGDAFNAKQLIEKSIEMIVKNWKQVKETEDWKEELKTSPELLMRIMAKF